MKTYVVAFFCAVCLHFAGCHASAKTACGNAEPCVVNEISPNLEGAVLSLDRQAIHTAFELRNSSDGAAAESLDELLGKLIRRDARLFLEEMKKTGQQPTPGLLGNLGPDYVDDFQAQYRELTLRMSALRAVTDPSLKLQRDRCLVVLQNDVDERDGGFPLK